MERRAMREQGFAPNGGLGIVQAMSAPGFEPATERGRDTVMVGIGNQLRDWARMAERSLRALAAFNESIGDGFFAPGDSLAESGRLDMRCD